MAKFRGKVGYLLTEEESIDGEGTGIWKEHILERTYYGDIIRNISRWESSGNLNDNISINNSVSIVADPFAIENFQLIKYVELHNQLWKVNTAEVQYPRIILSLGGVYNEDTNGTT